MKKSAMLMLCLVLVFALAACAGTDTTPQGSVSDTVTVVDAEYFSLIDADHIFFFSDGRAGDTGNLAVWKNMKAVKAGNVYFGINEDQYNMAFTAMGKELYLEKLANAILNHGNIE